MHASSVCSEEIRSWLLSFFLVSDMTLYPINYVLILMSLIHFTQGNTVHFQSIGLTLSEKFLQNKSGYLFSLYCLFRSRKWHHLCICCITFVCGLCHLPLNFSSFPSSWSPQRWLCSVPSWSLVCIVALFFPFPFHLTFASFFFMSLCIHFCQWLLSLPFVYHGSFLPSFSSFD